MNNNWLRREDESEYAYIYRIGSIKEQIGSWQGVADLINGQLGYEYTESKYRKDYNAFKKMFDANREHFVDTAGQLSDLEERELALKREARKFYDQRQALTRIVTKQARDEELHDCIAESAERLNEMFPLLPNPAAAAVSTGKNEALLCLTDWHYGMVCDNIFNRYDTDVCRERVARLRDEVQRRVLLHDISVLHVALLGDFAHGAIHTTARVEAKELVSDQLIHVSELLAEFISELSDMVSTVNVYATYGNHMRTVPNKKENVHEDNMEKIIPWWLEARLAQKENIFFRPSIYEFIYLPICGDHICLTHGDLDTVRDFGVTANTLFSRKFGATIDYAIMGDKHHNESLDRYGIDSIIAPALCGSDSHANGKRLYAKPAQLMITFRPESGKDAVYHLNFERRKAVS